MMKRSLMVPGSLSSALQTMYFSLPGAWRTISHLLPVGNPAPPMPRSPLAFRVAITLAPIRVLDKLPDHRIFGITAVWIGGYRRPIFHPRWSCFSVGSCRPERTSPHEPHRAQFVEVAIDMIVDRESWRLVAAAETGDVTHSNLFRTASAESLVQPVFQVAAAAQMAGHIGADAHFSLGRRREMEVGIKTGYCMDLAERHLNLSGKILQPIGRQVTELMLYGPEFVDQAPGSPWFRIIMTSLSEILASNVPLGEWRTWGRKYSLRRCPSVSQEHPAVNCFRARKWV